MSARDLLGYGFNQPRIVWPNGARVAVSVTINFEEGAEFAVGDGDDRNETFSEVLSVVTPGIRDMAQEQVFAYGMRAGLPRFLDVLRRRKMPATFMMCGRAVERSPDFAHACVADGHEAAVHGWRWASHFGFIDIEAERAELRRSREVIERVTGFKPVGFMCRSSQSAFTRRLLAEEGFIYNSNALDDDLPYFDETESGRILVLPYAFDTNDMKYYQPTGFSTGDEFLSYLQRALEVLLTEAGRGATRVMNIGLHLRISGRPSRFWAVEHFLERLQTFGDQVWVARRCDIARHWLANERTSS